MLRRSLILGLSAVASLGLVACGDGNNDSGSAATATEAAPAPAATTDTGGAAAGGTELKLAADPSGRFAFDKKTLQAGAGKVTIDLANESQVPHNVTIEGTGDQDLGATETITASQTSKTFDLKPGKYTFYCSVDDHRQGGMEGTLTVK